MKHHFFIIVLLSVLLDWVAAGVRSTATPESPWQRPAAEEDVSASFASWLLETAKRQAPQQVALLFVNSTVPDNLESVHGIVKHLNIPTLNNKHDKWQTDNACNSQQETNHVLQDFEFPLDPYCTSEREKWWYRTYDGSCNWLKHNQTKEGQAGQPKSRDYDQHAFADGISKPREGPNARAISNAFFRRNETIYYEHTPLLLGLVEFIMHDVTYSQDSDTEYVEVPMPPDETEFLLNTKFRVPRARAIPGTGTSRENPREIANMVTTWMDLSALYGSSAQVAQALRAFRGGKLQTQEVNTTASHQPSSYLPFNTMGVPTRTRPGMDPSRLFAGGDARTNEDWIVLAVHTLFLREHNRLCDMLSSKYPQWDDEQLYQTARVVLSAKYQLIGNSYQMAYFTDKMPSPQDDGFPLFRQIYGYNVLELNPAMKYPWPLVTKKGRPIVVSNEMGVVYRFHEFIIPHLPIKDANNVTIRNQDLFSTGFNATGFVDTGLENVLRGMTASAIPNFKSGVDETFRSAGRYRGRPFDIVTWSKFSSSFFGSSMSPRGAGSLI
jgi:hypothetical protein